MTGRNHLFTLFKIKFSEIELRSYKLEIGTFREIKWAFSYKIRRFENGSKVREIKGLGRKKSELLC